MDTSREKFEEGKWTAEAASAFGAKVEDRGRRMRARDKIHDKGRYGNTKKMGCDHRENRNAWIKIVSRNRQTTTGS